MKFLSTLFTTLVLATAALAAPVEVEAREAEAAPGYTGYKGYGSCALTPLFISPTLAQRGPWIHHGYMARELSSLHLYHSQC
jgi:hypothetical protein